MSEKFLNKEKKFEWCILQVRSGTEAKVAKIINDHYLTEDLEEMFVPALERINSDVSNEKSGKKDNSFFHGYVFIKMNLQSNLVKQISNIPLVYNFLNQNGKAKVISEQEIQDIKDSIKENIKLAFGSNLSVGSTVQVTNGAFELYTGVIEEIVNDKVKVKIVFCGRDVIVTFNKDQLKCTG